MLSNKPLKALSQAERQLLRYQRLQSGQCVRCFRATRSRLADEAGSPSVNSVPNVAKSSDGSKVPDQSDQSPSRHQRAAKVSEEVRLLSRDVSSLGPAKPQNDSIGFEGAGQQTDREASTGRMGENNSLGREGPQAQGVGRPVRSIDERDDGTQQVRGVRTPNSAIEEPTKGGASILGEEPRAAEDRRKPAQTVTTSGSAASTTSVSLAGPRIPGPGQSYKPTALSKEQYLHSGSRTSTIAASNFEGAVKDRIRAAADPAGPFNHRSIPELAHRLQRKKLVQYASKQEIKATNDFLREHYTGSQALSKAELKAQDKGRTLSRGRSLPESIRRRLMETIVKGTYDQEGLLSDTQKHKQPVLNQIAKMTTMNGTYLSTDGDRLLKKVQSLLPLTSAQPQRRPVAGQAKAKA